MLVISRKIGEAIVLGENIKVTIVSAGNDKVTLGIEAPRDVKIVREELLETIAVNKASAEKIDGNNFSNIIELLKNNKNN